MAGDVGVVLVDLILEERDVGCGGILEDAERFAGHDG
jgi:hypothetical protein